MEESTACKFCALQHYIPSFVKHAAAFGYDCIWLDLEHRAFDDREVQSLLTMSHLHDIDVMVRPSTLEKKVVPLSGGWGCRTDDSTRL